ncbi:MAG: twin-arginine translocase subunit TatC, partial [Deltaproteobacteria bacterium]
MTEDTQEKISLTAHLEDLKKRLINIFIAIAIGFLACYGIKDAIFKIITQPLLDVLPKGSFMVFTSLPEAFIVYLKTAFFASIIITSPYTLLQIWKFVAPGLRANEKKYLLPFVFFSSSLFVGGILFGYFFALPPAFSFFMEFSSDALKPMITFGEYLSFTMKLLLGFGICFELPIFIFFLTKVGIINATKLSNNRRYAILVIFIIAAIITPSPDALT